MTSTLAIGKSSPIANFCNPVIALPPPHSPSGKV